MGPAVQRVAINAVVATARRRAGADFALIRKSRNGSLRGGRSVIGFAMYGAGEVGDIKSAPSVAPPTGDGTSTA
jgi:hypothetical protein